jgi:hypothetical protein
VVGVGEDGEEGGGLVVLVHDTVGAHLELVHEVAEHGPPGARLFPVGAVDVVHGHGPVAAIWGR